jgi:hypothetical protein
MLLAPAPISPEPELAHHPFWPVISPADFRAAMNVDGTVTTPRLVFALTEAIVYINAELKGFRLAHEADGAQTLADVPDDEPGRLVHLYKRAVYERASADVMERLIGISATGNEQKRAEQQEPAIDDHYRNSIWAVRDLLGQAHSTVALL